jgi:hypothetical protein
MSSCMSGVCTIFLHWGLSHRDRHRLEVVRKFPIDPPPKRTLVIQIRNFAWLHFEKVNESPLIQSVVARLKAGSSFHVRLPICRSESQDCHRIATGFQNLPQGISWKQWENGARALATRRPDCGRFFSVEVPDFHRACSALFKFILNLQERV